jgi:uncharacterized protein YkwD
MVPSWGRSAHCAASERKDSSSVGGIQPLRIAVVRSLAAAAALLLIALPTTMALASSAPATNSDNSRTLGLEAELLRSINALRFQHGLSRLSASAGLQRAAAAHSAAMARRGFFGHEVASGDGLLKRLRRSYPPRRGRPWFVGENLVWSSPRLDAEQAFATWVANPIHRRTLLNPRFRDVGLAAVHASSAPGVFRRREVTILTADFGVRD